MIGLPKEVAAFVLAQGERTRREVTRLVARELRRVFERVDWTREARRLLRGMRLQVRADIRLVPKRRGRTTRAAAAAPERPPPPARPGR